MRRASDHVRLLATITGYEVEEGVRTAGRRDPKSALTRISRRARR